MNKYEEIRTLAALDYIGSLTRLRALLTEADERIAALEHAALRVLPWAMGCRARAGKRGQEKHEAVEELKAALASVPISKRLAALAEVKK